MKVLEAHFYPRGVLRGAPHHAASGSCSFRGRRVVHEAVDLTDHYAAEEDAQVVPLELEAELKRQFGVFGDGEEGPAYAGG